MFLLLCLPSGCGHPFGSIVSFVTIDCERRFPLEVVSCTMSPPISGVCRRFPTSSVGLSGLLVAGDHAFTWLVTVLASTLSSPGFLCYLARCLRCAGCPCGGAHTACWALTFLGFLPVLRHPTGSSSPCSGGFSSPLWFPTFTMGSPLRG